MCSQKPRRRRRGGGGRLAVLGAALASLCSQTQQAYLVLLRELARHVGQTAELLGLDASSVQINHDDPTLLCSWFEALYVLTRDVKRALQSRFEIQQTRSESNSKPLRDRLVNILDEMKCNLLLNKNTTED